MATTPQPIGGGSAEGWTLKQIRKEIPLTDSAGNVLELAQRFAAEVGATTVEPLHVLAAIVFLPRNPARRALEAVGADMGRLESVRVGGGSARRQSPASSRAHWARTPVSIPWPGVQPIRSCGPRFRTTAH